MINIKLLLLFIYISHIFTHGLTKLIKNTFSVASEGCCLSWKLCQQYGKSQEEIPTMLFLRNI